MEANNTKKDRIDQLEKTVDAFEKVLNLTREELAFKESQITALENLVNYSSEQLVSVDEKTKTG